MLADFVFLNRAAILEGARVRVASRASPKPNEEELVNGIPVFVDQVISALRLAESSRRIDHAQIALSASQHGHHLFRMGLTIAQVVHDYGDVCQTVTELAAAQGARISASEFQTLNLCLDDAIAEAVTQFASERESALTDRGTERLGMLAHELRNLLNTAMLSFETITSGRVAPGGSTALIHGKSLLGLRDLIDGSLADVRLDAGLKNIERIPIAQFIEEIEIGALMQARARGVRFGVEMRDRTLTVQGDRPLRDLESAAECVQVHSARRLCDVDGPRNGRLRLPRRRGRVRRTATGKNRSHVPPVRTTRVRSPRSRPRAHDLPACRRGQRGAYPRERPAGQRLRFQLGAAAIDAATGVGRSRIN